MMVAEHTSFFSQAMHNPSLTQVIGNRIYIAIDLKSFYASVECVERGLDPLKTKLVVADESRTDKTICLAVSPALKALGISGRARLFEVLQKIPRTDFIAAQPRMSLYIDYSSRIYNIYLKYVSNEDIHVYSIDEVFIDATKYIGPPQPSLKGWEQNQMQKAHNLAMKMIRDVLAHTGITATAGIGTNLYLCKIAMDIVAKHIPADKDGVRIAELDEMSYRRQLWDHKPLSSFWRVGKGIAKRLEPYGIDTMGKIARASIESEELFYRLFGVNAELLIDHAWGWEPCTIDEIKKYKPEINSLSSGQVLTEPYTFEKARNVVMEMADAASLDLVCRRLATDQLSLTVSYDCESLTRPEIACLYHGEIIQDHYGRLAPKYAHGTATLNHHTSSSRIITDAIMDLYDSIVNRGLLIRRLNITTNNVISEDNISHSKGERESLQLDLFTDYETLARKEESQKKQRRKERNMQEAILSIKHRFGKNAILRGTSYAEGATQKERNQQIGGHKA